MTETKLDFNDAGDQRTFEVIPAGSIVTLQMIIRPGAAGDGGWLKRSADGGSEGLDCEFIVVDGPYAKRKLWQLYTLHGTTAGHTEAGEISRKTLKAILESARGIRPDDTSEAAKKARSVADWNEFNNLRFVARLGVRPPKGDYAAKNVVLEIITPDRQVWKKPEQIDPAAASAKAPDAAAPTTPPANAITRPQWAG